MNGTMVPVDISVEGTDSKLHSREVVSYSLTLKESLREVVRSLEKQRDELYHTPSVLPVKGEDVWLSCDFGRRINPLTGRREFHSGIDVAGGYKTPIIAPAQGRVYEIGKSRLLGNYIRVRHRRDLRTTYGHLHSFAAKEGERVERGDVIGYMGNTGRSTGTHVHYEVVEGGKARNPMKYILDRKGETLSLR
jgi:murein DD-endopeptidase MepM/ murein hydrolase activator NlpD